MAITFVGWASGTGSSAAPTIDLTGLGLLEGDLVIVASGHLSTSNNDPGVTSPSGYTEVADLYGNDTRDANFSVAWKIMGATPDTSVTTTGSGSATNAAAAVAYVLRGVDPTTPLDVAVTTATGGNSAVGNSPSITPVTSGAWVLTTFLGTGTVQDTTIDPPAGYTDQALVSHDPGNSVHIAMARGSTPWESGAVDPGAWLNVTTSTGESWAAVSLAIRPEPDPLDEPYAAVLTTGGSTSAATSYATASVTVTAGRPVLAIVYAAGVGTADNNTAPTLTGAGQTWDQVASFIPALAAEYQDYQRATIFKASAASGGSGALTFSFGSQSQDIIAWQVIEAVGGDFGAMEGEASTATNATSHSLSLAGVGGAERYLALGLWVNYAAGSPGGFTPRSGWIELAEVDSGDAGIDNAIQSQLSPLGGDTAASFTTGTAGGLTLVAFRVGPPGDPPGPIVGTFSATETGADAAGFAGAVRVSGGLAVAETGNDTFAATGTVADAGITGSLAASEAGEDAFAGAGAVPVAGAVAAQEAGLDVLAGAGAVRVSGALWGAETGADAASFAGAVQVAGALSAQEAGSDVLTATGGPIIVGSLAATEAGADAFEAVGAVSTPETVVAGSLAAQEAGQDTTALFGRVRVAGALSAGDAGQDTATGAGGVVVSGGLASMETGADVFASAGTVTGRVGLLDALEGGLDGFYGTGGVRISGAIIANEFGADAALFSGSLSGWSDPQAANGEWFGVSANNGGWTPATAGGAWSATPPITGTWG